MWGGNVNGFEKIGIVSPDFYIAGQNLIHHMERRYIILAFARDQKKSNGTTVLFTYLGSAERVSYECERPIKIVWRLHHPMSLKMFENNRRGG